LFQSDRNVLLIFVDDEVTFHWYVIGVCVGIGTVLIVMLVLLPYCIWKKRRGFIMKIIHYFQNYEDDGKNILVYQINWTPFQRMTGNIL
jgi:hypothetical protein